MPCVTADGSLTEVARAVLIALQTRTSLEAVANATDLPLFRIRASVREMHTAELLTEQSGEYEITAKGAETLELG